MTKSERKLADLLFKIGAIKFGAFKLKLHETNPDAPLSPIYIDLRLLQSYPLAMDAAVFRLCQLIKGLKFDVLAGIPLAATPLTAILANKIRKPMITPRPPKTHGISGGLDGAYKKGQKVLVVDDLVTRADSKIEVINSLKDKDLKVRDIVVLIDRQQGGAKQLAKAGCKLHTAFALSGLLSYYLEMGKISQKKFNEVIKYLSS